MFKDKDLRKGIIASVLASFIFLIFIQPILSFAWKNIVTLSIHTYTGYIDSIYENAALGKRNWIDFLILGYFLFFLFLVLFAFSMIFRLFMEDLDERKQMRLMTEKEKEDYIVKRRSLTLKKVYVFEKHAKKLIIPTYVYQVLIFLIFANDIFSSYVDLKLNTSFAQRCTVIAPYIDDQTQKILQSKWASMKSRKDYEVVNKYLEDIAKSKNVVLPEVLLK